MTTNTELIKIAKKYLGQGGAIFRKFCNLPAGSAYCNAFVDYIANAGGVAKLYFNGTKYTYCPSSYAWCKKNLAALPMYLAMPADIIYFDWDRNGNPNHIGLVEKRKDSSSIYTIEGNTDKKDKNGKTLAKNVVAERTRGPYVLGVFRPQFVPKSVGKCVLKIDGLFEYKSIYNLQLALGMKATGIFTQETLKVLQRKVGTTADAIWGPGTSKKVQKLIGAKQDGQFGPESAKKLQAWCNKVNYPTSEKKPAETKPAPPASTPATSTRQKMKAIGHARKDYDHKAGDSSGKEVLRSGFTYSASKGSVYNWTYVFRPKDAAKANKAAAMCERAIANNAIGYNSHGETAYGKAKAMTKLAAAAGYDLGKIKTKCGLSCGDLICLCNRWAGLSTCYIGSGRELAAALKKNPNFTTIKYKKGMQLYRGDVLITAHSNGKNNHVVMVL